ncbi:O-antigen polymerase [Exiguobacterium sp. s138]|uniref:O-antigen polymerase n=1 Tax=Exiguobacterium sp. s138 TaxID=2751202 RepID=UPI001BE9C963|nr:O-antigen polymerase [Exiguobacterium sp. s138]
MIILFIIFSWFLVVFNFFVKKDFLYPAFLQSILWSIVITIYGILGGEYRELQFKTLLIILLGNISFTITSFIVIKILDFKKTSEDLSLKRNLNLKVMFILTLFNLIFFPSFLIKLYSVSSFSNLISYSDTIGAAKLDGELSSYAIFMWVAIVSCLLSLNKILKTEKKFDRKNHYFKVIFALNLLISMSYVLLFSARNFLIGFLISLIFLSILNKKISFIKAITLSSVFFTIVFIGYSFIQDSNYLESITYQSKIETIYKMFLLYTIGSLSAFDYVVNTSVTNYEFGINSFRIILLRFNDIGFNFPISSLVKEFVFVPYATNVYTYLLPYYEDFGWIGVVVFNFVLGGCHSIVYYRARQGRFFSQVLYVLTLEALFYQFFTDFYFTILTKWIVYIFILFSIKLLSRSGEKNVV